MKIFIICSKHFYNRIPDIQKFLEEKGHEITLPNSYADPATESRYLELGFAEHAAWKSGMLRQSASKIESMDAVLVLNFEKNGVPNYIGGATFLEMYDAFRLGKKIFMYNDIPEGMLRDEICAFNPTVLKGNLNQVT